MVSFEMSGVVKLSLCFSLFNGSTLARPIFNVVDQYSGYGSLCAAPLSVCVFPAYIIVSRKHNASFIYKNISYNNFKEPKV